MEIGSKAEGLIVCFIEGPHQFDCGLCRCHMAWSSWVPMLTYELHVLMTVACHQSRKFSGQLLQFEDVAAHSFAILVVAIFKNIVDLWKEVAVIPSSRSFQAPSHKIFKGL